MSLFKFSEVWMALFALVGTILEKLEIVPADAWNAIIVPTLLYIVGRVIGNVSKGRYTLYKAGGPIAYDERSAVSGKVNPQ